MRARTDGSERATLFEGANLYDYAVTDAHVFVVQYSKTTPNTPEERDGTLFRFRFVP